MPLGYKYRNILATFLQSLILQLHSGTVFFLNDGGWIISADSTTLEVPHTQIKSHFA